MAIRMPILSHTKDTTMKNNNSIPTYLALATAVFFWGLSFIATKIALQSFTPFCLIFFRFFTAAIFFIFLLWRTGFPSFTGKTLKSLLLLALMEPGLYFLFETFGLQYTSATKTSLIIATIPIVVLVLSAFFLKERLRPINMLGIVISLAGVAMLVFGGRVQTALNGMMFGDMLIIGAVLAASVYMILTRRLGESLSSLQITGMQIIFGALLFFPLFLWDLPKLNWQEVSRESFIALIVLTIFATIGAFLCYNYALTRIPAAQAAVCINGIPLVTACGAWALLGETLTSMQLMGGILVLVSVLLANHTPKIEVIPDIPELAR
jgi:drug/metabolite transporter (DMT)-like permease